MNKVGEKMKEELSEQQATALGTSNGPCVDFSFQFNTAKEYEKVEKKIFEYICELSNQCSKNNVKRGVIAVIGRFDSSKDYLSLIHI